MASKRFKHPFREHRTKTYDIFGAKTRSTIVNLCGDDVKITLGCDLRSVEEWVGDVPRDTSLFGLDVEDQKGVAGQRSIPAMLQLAYRGTGGRGRCIVISLGAIAGFPLRLVDILGCNIARYGGVGIEDDVKGLGKRPTKKLDVRNWQDVRHVAADANISRSPPRPFMQMGLVDLYDFFFSHKPQKYMDIILSDWTLTPLTDAQITYAAQDSWCSFKILEYLSQDRPRKPPTEGDDSDEAPDSSEDDIKGKENFPPRELVRQSEQDVTDGKRTEWTMLISPTSLYNDHSGLLVVICHVNSNIDEVYNAALPRLRGYTMLSFI